MAEPGALETIVAEIGKLLLPLRAAVESPAAFQGLLLKLGWDSDVIPKPIADLAVDLQLLFDRLQALVGGGLSLDGEVASDGEMTLESGALEDAFKAIEAIAGVVQAIDDLVSAPGGAFSATLNADNFKGEFPGQLVGYLFITYLRNHHPGIGFALQALGVISTRYTAPAGNRPDYIDYRFSFPDLPKIVSDPVTLFENAFGWGTDSFDFSGFARQIDSLAAGLGLDVRMVEVPDRVARALEGGPPTGRAAVRKRLRLVFFERARDAGRLSAELGLFPLPKSGGKKPGFALLPSFSGLLSVRMQLGPTIAVTISSDLDLTGGVGLMVRPGSGIDMVTGFAGSGAPTSAKGTARVEVEYSAASGSPTIVLGTGEGTRLEYQSVSGAGGFTLVAGKDVEVFAEVDLKGLAFVLDASGSDGFVSTILSGISTRFEFDLGLGVAYPRGVYFRGTSHLEIQIPAHIDLGPIEVQGLTLAVTPSGGGLPIDIGATLKAALGPLVAVVENIGLRTDLAFPGSGGNLGPIDLSFGFKPPNGVGLSIDAGAVTGGGYLFIDPDRGEYAGALELKILDFLSVTAIGVITTKMPDGSKGFSFIAIITVEFNPGMQLGFGFTLLGVGGLVGLNRSMDLDALVNGVRAGSLDSVLFPHDVVANAHRIISDLRTFFPPEQGTFLIGPMAKFGWGTPTLISLSLGIIIEIPGNIAIIGKLTVAIPDERLPLIIIQVAFMGAIEFDKKRGWFFAILYESRVIFMPLDGGMGVLASFGGDATFIVSVGGFHPAYNPPPLPFPPIPRIAINILNTPVARIRVDAYFAVTSNTVQFGAHAELYFGISIASIEGHLAFDALFQFSPFYFIITISASLSVKLFGAGLFSIRFRGSLEGTSPWHVEGTGSISLLFWDVDVDFSHTWGDKEDTSLPPVSVLPLLVAEYSKAENWTAALQNSSRLLVTLKTVDAGSDLVLHPVGSLKITQRAIPLGITLDKIGAQRPDDANYFAVAAATSGIEKRATIRESFAIAQFKDLKDGEKLSASDYEAEEAGLELSVTGNQAKTSYVTKRIARYEEIIVDNNFKRARRRFVTLISGLFTHFLANNAVARSEISAKSRDLKHGFDDKIAVDQASYVVVSLVDNSPIAGAPASFQSRASAGEFMAAETRRNPSFASEAHIVRPHEMKRAA
ncbi:DUF6603 domain-containing protein [Bradyrhizobium sp. HKCCYLS3013]|uniref:DUF6603 domain-containing protein n=1 Tax=Bradyrhizobium sp. HKCCYLS3013 TaxID=3420735 RepID=UPI003EB76135